MRRLSLALLLVAIAAAKPAPKAYFQFHSDHWLNLHQPLYREAARLDSKRPIQPLNTSALTAKQLAAWNKAVAYYHQHFHGKSLGFDDELIQINNALEKSPNPGSKLLVQHDLAAQLKAVSPIYKRVWWPQQLK